MQVRCPVTQKLTDLWHPIRMAKTFNSHKWVQMNRRQAGTETHAHSHSLQKQRASEVETVRNRQWTRRGEMRQEVNSKQTEPKQIRCCNPRTWGFFLISMSTLAFLLHPMHSGGYKWDICWGEGGKKTKKTKRDGDRECEKVETERWLFLQVDRINEWRGWSDVVVS